MASAVTARADARYWRPEPRRHGFAWWALLAPAVVYSAGVIVYAHAAFVPGAIRPNGHAVGSALMVIGGEAGTLAAASEVFRKSCDGETTVLDWFGLTVSLIATLGNLFVVYTALTALSEPWVSVARRYGPLALLLCSGLDFYANVMEFGFYNASFDARWEQWNDARHAWEQRKQSLSAPSSGARSESAGAASDELTPLSCPYCGAERNARGEPFATQQAVSAHLAHCKAYQRAHAAAKSGES